MRFKPDFSPSVLSDSHDSPNSPFQPHHGLPAGFRYCCQRAIAVRSFFIESQLRANLYSGERSPSGEGLRGTLKRLGPGVTVGMGYTLSKSFEVVGELSYGNYPGIGHNTGSYALILRDESSQNSWGANTSLRYRFREVLGFKPFISSGLGLAVRKVNSEYTAGVGPVWGIGATLPFSGFELTASISQMFVFPNRTLDLAGTGLRPDVLSAVSLGLRHRFNNPEPRLGQIVISGPHTLQTGSGGVFTASTNLDPLQYSVRWTFGDGTEMLGASVRHTFRSSGNYTVKATVFNQLSSSEAEMMIQVQDSYEKVSLLSLSVVPQQPNIGDSVVFTPLLTGNEITCQWTFGDGNSSDTCTTNHVYSRAGTFRVTLSAFNQDHSVQSTQTLLIQNDACTQLPDLSTVYFRAHSSELTLEMRQLLRDNLSTASACSERSIEIVGYALSTERDAQNLAVDRASQVYQYYRNLGISATRVLTSKTVIVPAEDLEGLPWTARSTTSRFGLKSQ
ncbi:MAG: PKD domain-containing protein [Bacteroidetes bacterium]|nr:PKD domain-containing protein [Bacteroidota bacterium]